MPTVFQRKKKRNKPYSGSDSYSVRSYKKREERHFGDAYSTHYKKSRKEYRAKANESYHGRVSDRKFRRLQKSYARNESKRNRHSKGAGDSYAIRPKKRVAMKFQDSYSVAANKNRRKENFHDSYSSRRNRPKNYDAPKQKYKDKKWYDYLVFWNKGKRKMKEPKQKRRSKPQLGLFGPKGK